MELDYALVREILTALKPVYPGPIDDVEALGIEHPQLVAHLHYLREHAFVQFNHAPLLGTPAARQIDSIAATARGLDWLLPDGGLGSDEHMVTVRFDEETLRAFLSAHVNRSTAPPDLKRSLLDAVRKAPDQALQTIVRRLTEAALDRLPNEWQTIQSILIQQFG